MKQGDASGIARVNLSSVDASKDFPRKRYVWGIQNTGNVVLGEFQLFHHH